MRAVSATDGTTLAEYKLDKLPAWDGIASAYGRLFIVNQDGSIECWGEKFPAFQGHPPLDRPYLTRNKHLGYHASRVNPHYSKRTSFTI